MVFQKQECKDVCCHVQPSLGNSNMICMEIDIKYGDNDKCEHVHYEFKAER